MLVFSKLKVTSLALVGLVLLVVRALVIPSIRLWDYVCVGIVYIVSEFLMKRGAVRLDRDACIDEGQRFSRFKIVC